MPKQYLTDTYQHLTDTYMICSYLADPCTNVNLIPTDYLIQVNIYEFNGYSPIFD